MFNPKVIKKRNSEPLQVGKKVMEHSLESLKPDIKHNPKHGKEEMEPEEKMEISEKKEKYAKPEHKMKMEMMLKLAKKASKLKP